MAKFFGSFATSQASPCLPRLIAGRALVRERIRREGARAIRRIMSSCHPPSWRRRPFVTYSAAGASDWRAGAARPRSSNCQSGDARGRLVLGSARIARDVRYAFRQLQRSPDFHGDCPLTLAIGIGTKTAISRCSMASC